MLDGWISLHRQIMDSEIWCSEPFTRAQAWIDLLMLANHRPRKVLLKGRTIELECGQLAWSEKALAQRWQWSRGKVDRFLTWLKNEHQIAHQKNNVTTLITVINYERFQKTDTKRTPNGHQTDTDNNVNNNNISPPPAREAEILNVYELAKGELPDQIRAVQSACPGFDKLAEMSVANVLRIASDEHRAVALCDWLDAVMNSLEPVKNPLPLLRGYMRKAGESSAPAGEPEPRDPFLRERARYERLMREKGYM